MILNAVAKIVTWYLYLRLIEYAFENIPTPTVFAKFFRRCYVYFPEYDGLRDL